MSAPPFPKRGMVIGILVTVLCMTTLWWQPAAGALEPDSTALQALRTVEEDEELHSCLIKLACLLGSSNATLSVTDSLVLRGIAHLAVSRRDPLSHLSSDVYLARTDKNSQLCREAWSSCPLSARELLEAHSYSMKTEVSLSRPTSAPFHRDRRSSRPTRKPRPYRRQGYATSPYLEELLSHPLRRPADAMYRHECRACEAKRSACTMFALGTYGICGAVWLLGGKFGSWACNVMTLPRSANCYQNTIVNCYLRDCGLFKF